MYNSVLACMNCYKYHMYNFNLFCPDLCELIQESNMIQGATPKESANVNCRSTPISPMSVKIVEI